MIYLLPFIILNAILYLFTAYIHWDISFITDMGNWHVASRVFSLLFFFIFNGIALGVCACVAQVEEEKKENESLARVNTIDRMRCEQ